MFRWESKICFFIYVTIEATIDIICKYCYQHPTLPKLKIPIQLLRQLLLLCTQESVFRAPQGKLYQQIDGIAMGSALGPTFANFYMANLETIVLSEDKISNPVKYLRLGMRLVFFCTLFFWFFLKKTSRFF